MLLLLAGLLFLTVDLSQQQFFCHNTQFNLTETTPSVGFWHQTITEGTKEEECAIIATVLGRLEDCTSIRIQMRSDLSLFGLLNYTNEHAFGFKCKSYYETCNSPKKLLSLTNVKWDEDSYNNKLLVGDRQAFDCVRKHLHRLYWSNQPDYIMEKKNFKPRKTRKIALKKKEVYIPLIQLFTEKNLWLQLGMVYSNFLLLIAWVTYLGILAGMIYLSFPVFYIIGEKIAANCGEFYNKRGD